MRRRPERNRAAEEVTEEDQGDEAELEGEEEDLDDGDYEEDVPEEGEDDQENEHEPAHQATERVTEDWSVRFADEFDFDFDSMYRRPGRRNEPNRMVKEIGSRKVDRRPPTGGDGRPRRLSVPRQFPEPAWTEDEQTSGEREQGVSRVAGD